MILHKHYKFCPECQSVMIRRAHRGFIQKYIFRQKQKYKCGNCKTVFFNPLFEKDIKKLSKEEAETSHEIKPIIRIEEIRAMNFEQEKTVYTKEKNKAKNKAENKKNNPTNNNEFERKFERKFEKELQIVFEKGFEKGFAEGFEKGIQH